jgi:NADPH:quinone reductase-like Zn-dependent oxidoreductase
MKAFAVTSYKPLGYLQHLEEVRIPKPSAARHDIVVKVKAVATNPIDYKRLGNLGNSDAKFEVDGPLVVGWDASGIVEQVGPDVTLYQPGDEVMFAGDFFRPVPLPNTSPSILALLEGNPPQLIGVRQPPFL